MPGESANSEPIIPSEDAPIEGFNMGKYLVRTPRPEAKTKIPLSAFISELC